MDGFHYMDMSGNKTDSNPERFEPWFLEMHKDEACRFMSQASKQKRGVFCVRLSSAPKSYAISILNENGEFYHYSISIVDDFYILEVDTKPVPVRSLKEVVAYFKKHVPGSKPIDKKSSNYTTHLISIASNDYITHQAMKNYDNYVNDTNKDPEKIHDYVNLERYEKPLPKRNCHSDSTTPTSAPLMPPYHRHHSAKSALNGTYCLDEENENDYQNISEEYDLPYELPNR